MKDGGAAFPVQDVIANPTGGVSRLDQNWEIDQKGMTMRQWYAGQAIASGASQEYLEFKRGPVNEYYYAECAKWAFRMADAMIEAENK